MKKDNIKISTVLAFAVLFGIFTYEHLGTLVSTL